MQIEHASSLMRDDAAVPRRGARQEQRSLVWIEFTRLGGARPTPRVLSSHRPALAALEVPTLSPVRGARVSLTAIGLLGE